MFHSNDYPTLDAWIARTAIPFSIDTPATFDGAVDTLVASLDDSVEVLGFGEALHGGEEILVLRNQLFRRLVEVHGYSAIVIESSFPKARVVNEYVLGRGAASFEAVQATGFGSAFGQLVANRELVEWMRQRNADPAQRIRLQFYGFDIPSGMVGIGSPQSFTDFDWLAVLDSTSYQRGGPSLHAWDAGTEQ